MSMFPVMRTLTRVTIKPTQSLMIVQRGIHIDTARVGHQEGHHELMSDTLISSGTHSSTERINRFMNAIYVNKPRSVSLFSFNYKQFAERNTVRGICIGTNSRRPGQHKNVVVVSGLPHQDPSLIGVGLYVAAMLALLSPMLPKDVSVIPLAHPKEYEHRWKTPRVGGPQKRENEEEAGWIGHENVSLDVKDSCKPLETYIARRNKYYVNIAADLTKQGSAMRYTSNSLTSLAASGKHRTFLMDQSPITLPFPSSLSPSLPSHSSVHPSAPLILEPRGDVLIAPMLETPSLVVELKGTHALDDEQVVARGEEVIRMVKELLEQ